MRTTQTTLLLLMLLISVAWAKPAAMVIDLKGEAKAGNQELQLLDSLEPGSKIQLSNQSKISLNFLVNGKRYSAQGPSSLEVTARGIRVLAGDKNSVKKMGGRKRSSKANLGPVSLTMGAEFHRKSSGMLILPVGNVLTPYPTFSWTAHPEAELYRLDVMDGATPVFSTETESLSVTMPRNVAALTPQKQYNIRLTSFIEDDEEEMQVVQKSQGTLSYVKDRTLQKILQRTTRNWEKRKIDRALVVEAAGQCLGAALYQDSLNLVQMLDPDKDPVVASLQNRIYDKVKGLIRD